MSLTKNLNLSLIEGNFSAEEAKEMLMKIYSAKLNFHQRKNLSSQERFGKDDETSLLRIPILNDNIEKIKALTNEAIINKSRLIISSEINILTV